LFDAGLATPKVDGDVDGESLCFLFGSWGLHYYYTTQKSTWEPKTHPMKKDSHLSKPANLGWKRQLCQGIWVVATQILNIFYFYPENRGRFPF